jgi:hypothetical protein
LKTAERFVILTLQAYFDDSGTKGTGRFMVMAGLLADAHVFAEVAEQWDKHLRARHPGPIQYFKMDEACGLDGEFRHWQSANRDAKIAQMANVIDRDDLKEFAAVVDLQAFQRVFSEWESVGGHHSLRQPYMLLYPYILSAVVAEAAQRSNSPLEIIFDRQDVFKSVIVEGYDDVLRSEIDPARRAVMPIRPRFGDDKDFAALQAADLLAGELRLLPEQSPMSRIGDLCPKLKASGHFKMIDENDLHAMGTFIKSGLKSRF